MNLARMIANAALCGATLLAASATAQTKTVLTPLKKSAWNASVASSATISIGTGPLSYSFFFKIDPDLCWNTGTFSYNSGNMAKIIGIGPNMVGYFASDTGTNLIFRYHHNQYNRYNVELCEAPTDGKWHHAVMTVSASKDKSCAFYLDGEAVYTGAQVIGYKDDNQQMSLMVNKGAYESQSGAFGGSLAEVSVWNRVLTAEDVLALKTGRPDSTALNNGCLAFWPMEEDADTTEVEDILGGYPLTISSSATHNFVSVDDFPEYAIGDSTVYVPIHRLYPTNRVTVAIGEDASVKNDMFEKDTTVTFTATAGGESDRFVRWYGDVPEDQAFNSTITIVADQEKTVVPYFAFDWLYDTTAKKMSDGYWTVGASLTTGTTNLKLGSPTESHQLPLLDLTKRIEDGESVSYALTGVAGAAFDSNTILEELWLPDSLEAVDSNLNVNWSQGAFAACTHLKKVVPFMPTTIAVIGERMFDGCSSLAGDLVLGGGDAECVVRQTTKTSSGKTAVYGQQFASTKITGVTVKPSVHSLPLSVFNGCSALTNVVFEKGSVTNISNSAFANCTKVTEFVMPERPELIEATAFNGWTSNQCRFVVHAADPGWAAYMADAANFISWDALDANTRAGYKTKFVGQTKPLGLSLANPKNQWLCNDSNGGMKILFR